MLYSISKAGQSRDRCHIRTMVVVASSMIYGKKKHFTSKFKTNKNSKLCVNFIILLFLLSNFPCIVFTQGRSRVFSKGGHSVSVVGCLRKNGLQKRGHGHPSTPSSYAAALPNIFPSHWPLTKDALKQSRRPATEPYMMLASSA